LSLQSSPTLHAILVAAGLAAATSASTAGPCALKQFASIPAGYLADGRNVLEVSIDGDPAKLLLDTGSPFNLLGRAYVDRRQMPVRDMGGAAYGLTGRALQQVTHANQLTLGNAVARDPSFLIGNGFGDGRDGGVVGVFGTDYLAKFDVELDPTTGRVKLFSPDHCPGSVVYWAKDYFRLAIHLTDDKHVETKVAVDGKELKALIDTGADRTTMRLAVARDLFGLGTEAAGAQARAKITGVEGVKVDTFTHVFHSLTFGDITLRDTKIEIADIDQGKGAEWVGSRIVGNPGQPDVIIGMSLLRQLHLFIAYSEPAIYFTIAEPKSAG
jgi:predicted aspartyl protease